MLLESILTCPSCKHQAAEWMPINACQFFYDCKGCGARLKPLAGRLLRVLLLRISTVTADSGKRKVLLGITGLPKDRNQFLKDGKCVPRAVRFTLFEIIAALSHGVCYMSQA